MNNDETIKQTIGIVGGMGPLATADLFSKIILNTDAASDNEHIHIVIDNYPQIPDRTEAIIKNTDLPIDYIVNSANKLKSIGAGFIVIPCNTSHYYYEKICEKVSIPIINMIEETAKFIKKQELNKVGLLATDGVKKTGLYKRYLNTYGIAVEYPSIECQELLMNLIYNEVKAGKTPHPEVLSKYMDQMMDNGVSAFILGCTELPIAFNSSTGYNLIDPTEILAKVSVVRAGYKLRVR